MSQNEEAVRRAMNSAGQVIVEVLLILPVFLFIVFMIMEIGHLAFRTILIHHTAYEVARIGSLTARPFAASPGCPQPALDEARMQKAGLKVFPRDAEVLVSQQPTLKDEQEGCMNYDVEVTLRQKVPLVFPLTGFVLGTPRGARARLIAGTVRMPIERPLFK